MAIAIERDIALASDGALQYNAKTRTLIHQSAAGRTWVVVVGERELRNWMQVLLWADGDTPHERDPWLAAIAVAARVVAERDAAGLDPFERLRASLRSGDWGRTG